MGLLETVVGLGRNGGCVAKSLLQKSHWLMFPLVGQVTCIESFIAPLQFAAVYFNLRDALPVLLGAARPLLSASYLSEETWLQTISTVSTGIKPGTVRLAEKAVAANTAGERQALSVAVCQLIISIAFVFLGLSSVHVPYPIGTQWAVVSLELALLYLLGIMANGVRSEKRLAVEKGRLARALKSGEAVELDTPMVLPLALNATRACTPNMSVEMPICPWTKPLPPADDPLGATAASLHLKAVEGAHTALKQLVGANKGAIAAELSAEAVRHQYQVR